MKLWSRKGAHKATKRLPLFTYLAYIMVATMVFTGVTFSGYISTTSGSDTATVAKFDVSVALPQEQGNSLVIDLNDENKKVDSYSFTVNNDSEVVVDYTVTVTLGNALPNGVTIEMALSGGTITAKTESDDKTVYTYSSEFGISAEATNHEWTLSFDGDPDTVSADAQINVAVSVAAEQRD